MPRSGILACVTVLEVIQRSSDFLARKGIDSPRLQSELLVAHVLQMPRMKLYLNFERALAAAELEALRHLVKRRATREPLQHILGSVSFCGLELAVTGDVLIPRPETELLAEKAWRFLSGFSSEPSSVLDFGTGSGCLAIVIAVKCPLATVHAVDISQVALEVARQNAARHGVAQRVQFHAGDGLAAVPDGRHFDLIVSNPPYIPSAEIPTLQLEVRDHEPLLALDGGPDGLEYHRRLASGAGPLLTSRGKLMLELGDGQSHAVSDLLASHGWQVESVERDDAARERILIARLSD
ncbi:MAG TPA: peptide chain release factor N(5)-glutamine methyltransferase [Candidatus Binatia bacterium]|nr:peptide chain release factor N(5)-glutamine methyltransferase [Candidatus Binatia bacterium]